MVSSFVYSAVAEGNEKRNRFVQNSECICEELLGGISPRHQEKWQRSTALIGRRGRGRNARESTHESTSAHHEVLQLPNFILIIIVPVLIHSITQLKLEMHKLSFLFDWICFDV